LSSEGECSPDVEAKKNELLILHTHALRGVHSPKGNDAFSTSVSDIPLISEHFSDSMENFQNLTFFQKMSVSVHQNIVMTF